MRSKKMWKMLAIVMGAVIFLAACGTTPIDANSTGIWDRYIVYNFSRIIIWLSELFGNYGIGIIVFTLIIRVLLIPLTKYQTQSTEKMQMMQPELKELQEKYASKDPETQQKLQEETAKLNEKYDYSMWAGCLPTLIQLPILMALYQAISRTEILNEGHFLWLQLGNPDPYFIVPVIAAILTWYNTRLTTINTAGNNSSMAMMQWTMPIMILIMGVGLPSAISLYWVASTGFTIVQTLIMSNPYKKREAREEQLRKERELERRLEKAKRNPSGKKK
ncbi:membrane protein insertase YidC [Aerococcus agrisoli]|uniref:Membrane protein insertase YidC n=1 Tax=Aerococcus agrisoli TaxID=2487350 RepID=A0A3N4GPU1_9LACT|nr:membrane protein insertase YidC [Aerococcus agrisoli]